MTKFQQLQQKAIQELTAIAPHKAQELGDWAEKWIGYAHSDAVIARKEIQQSQTPNQLIEMHGIAAFRSIVQFLIEHKYITSEEVSSPLQTLTPTRRWRFELGFFKTKENMDAESETLPSEEKSIGTPAGGLPGGLVDSSGRPTTRGAAEEQPASV